MASVRPTTSTLHWALATALGLGLAACSKPPATTAAPAAAQAVAAADAAQAAAKAAAEQQAAALAALSADELKARGRKALREQRIYSPAGNNAMEYYLALRKKSEKPDASAESALMDLQPYAVIAAEQALAKEDFDEAERLRALIAAADPQAPSLGRIGDAIAKGRAALLARTSDAATQTAAQAVADETAKTKAADKARTDEAAAAAAARALTTPSAVPVSPLPQGPAPQNNPEPVVTAPPAAPPQQQAPPPRPQPAAPSRPPPPTGNLVAVNTPEPVFPPEARRSRTAGQVVVSFTVNADGSVGDVNVVSARPRGVFERNVQNAVRKWRYQPMPGAQNVTRTFDFAP